MTQPRPAPPGAAPPGPAPPRHGATLRRPAWRRGASVETAVRAVATGVERLRTGVAQAEDAHRRDPDPARLRDRLEAALLGLATALEETIHLVDQLDQYALSTSHRRYDLAVRHRAVGTARALDWDTQPTEPARAAAARIEQALVGLDPESDDVERGYEDLRAELRRLQRALRAAYRGRGDRPLSPADLRAVIGETTRVLDTAAVGLLTALGVALKDGSSAGDTAIAAATGAAVAPRSARLVTLVDRRLRPAGAAERLAEVHADLGYLVGDFARAAAAEPPDRDRLEQLYAAALLQSSHAARSAQRIGWVAAHDYVLTVRQVPEVLAAAMAAVRAGARDRAGVLAPIREISESLGRYRTPTR
jgi:hypothetical protein